MSKQQQTEKSAKPDKIVASVQEVGLANPESYERMLEMHVRYQAEINAIEAKKSALAEDILKIVEASKVDTLYVVDIVEMRYQATLVKPEPTKKMDEKKTAKAIMKLAKVDAEVAAAIIEAGKITGKKSKPHVRISVSDNTAAETA